MKKAKLFQNGQSQAVRLPKEFRFKGKEVFASKVGDGVLLLPLQNPWQLFQESLNEFTSDFMTERDQPELQTREDF
jgi:antitoxin VapB